MRLVLEPTVVPSNVVVEPVLDNATQLRVSWEKLDPVNTNGILEEYRVYYVELERTDLRRRRAADIFISIKPENVGGRLSVTVVCSSVFSVVCACWWFKAIQQLQYFDDSCHRWRRRTAQYFDC